MHFPLSIERAAQAALALACVSLVFGVILLSGCGSGGEETTTSLAVSQDASEKPPATHKPPPQKLVVKDIRKGKGAPLPPISHRPRVTMTMLYTATVYETGKLYEKRQDPRHPLKIEFGPGLSKGWEEGLAGMRIGGRRELVVPESMMVEGPASTYVIDLLGFKKNGTKIYARELKQGLTMSKEEIEKLPKLTIPRQSGPLPKRIEIVDLRKGTGATLRKQDAVHVRYFQVLYPEVEKRSRTGRFGPNRYGLDEAIKGWQVGLPGMRVGGRRELILPPKFKYPTWKPSWGYAPYVSIYVIDLIGIKRG